MKEAYVTLVATDAYAAGALVLFHKLKEFGSKRDLVCLITANISSRVQEMLSKSCTKVIMVDLLRSTDIANLALLGRPELDITFTKIHLWRLIEYSKVVFLDADCFPLKSDVDQLFNYPSLSAAPDAGWPDCFNSGVFVTEPSEGTYQDLIQLASEKGSFDGGDQGLLNTYFSAWSTLPSHRLPFTFNTTPTAQYGYAPAHNQFGQNISVFHFIGENKPWKYQRFADGRVLPLGDTWEGVKDMVQEWWNTWDEYYGRVKYI
ncbi:MAG: nucleotide-diphospho-sugar transferase [Benjaminiella poitrasii]|nr:MAG: nucleotide-diphospho-sugar transferase [Benjaminiella poitrasii]